MYHVSGIPETWNIAGEENLSGYYKINQAWHDAHDAWFPAVED